MTFPEAGNIGGGGFTVLCVMLNVLEFNMSPREAIDAPRLHHAWFPDVVQVEPSLAQQHPGAVEALQRLGHSVKVGSRQGDAHSIFIDEKTDWYLGVADQRRSGAAAGY